MNIKKIIINFIPRIFFFLGILNFGPIGFAQGMLGTSKTDSLSQRLSQTLHDTDRVNTLNALYGEYIYSEPQKALEYAQQALQLAEKTDWKKGIGNSLHAIGHYYLTQGDYPNTLDYWLKALRTREVLNDRKSIAATYGIIGIVYRRQGNYSDALKHYFEALKMDKDLGNKNGMARHLGNIGSVYFEQDNYSDALKHYFEALKIQRELGDKKGIAINLGNIGNVYLEHGNYSDALKHYFEALKIDKELGNKSEIASKIGNIGNVYHEQGNYPDALKHYFEALEMVKKLGNKNGIAINLGNIGSLYTATGQFKDAMAYLDSALMLSTELGALSHQKDHHSHTSQLYDTLAQIAISKNLTAKAADHYRLAYTHYKKYSAAKDTLFNEEKSKKIGGLEAQHEWQMDALEKEKLEAGRRKLEAEAMKRRDMIQYTGIVLVLAILMLALLNSRRLLARFPERINVSRKGAKAQRFIAINKRYIAMALLFATIFLSFETVLIFFDAEIEAFTQNKVLYKTLVSCLFAGTVSIVYFFSEKRMAMTLGFNFKHKEYEFKHKEHEGGTKGTKFFNLFLVGISVLVLSWQNKTDSLKAELGKEMEDTTRVNTLNAIAKEYIRSSPDTSLLYAEQALTEAQNSEWQKGIANSHHSIGYANYVQGNYELCLFHWEKCLEIRKKQNDKQYIAVALGNIGSVYSEQGNYPVALKYHFEYLKMAKEIEIKKYQAIALGNIGTVYNDQGNYPDAMKYYFEALEINKELRDKRGMAVCLGNIGSVYHFQGNYPNALKNYFEALEIDKELRNKNGIAIKLGNIGLVYYDQGNYPDALKHCFKALEINKELENNNGIAIKLGNIGSIYTTTGRFKKAEAYLDSAIALCDTIGYLLGKKDFEYATTHLYDTLAQIAIRNEQWANAAENYRLAYTHYKKYDTAKDTLFNEEKSKEIGKLETRHEMAIAEFERKKKEEQEAETARIEKEREDKIGYSLVLVGFFGILALVLLLSRLTLPLSLIQIFTTMPFLLLFETAIVFMNPYIEAFVENAPAWKLAANFALALMIFPLHEWAEHLLKRVFRRKLRKKEESPKD